MTVVLYNNYVQEEKNTVQRRQRRVDSFKSPTLTNHAQ